MFLAASQLAEAADYLADLQDRLEVAELQRQMCVELAATSASTAVSTDTTFSHAAVEQALNELSRGPLLPASELFASYADPFDLHESKLLLLHFAGEAVSSHVGLGGFQSSLHFFFSLFRMQTWWRRFGGRCCTASCSVAMD